MADDILSILKEDEIQREYLLRLRSDIREQNAQAWDYFDAVIYSMQQNGLIILQRMDEVGEDNHSDSREALCLLHSGATITLCEIRTLLLEGLWAGASARWRALHELTVTAVLVAGGGTSIARRYLDHGFVVQTERLARFYDHHARGPLPEATLRQRQIKSNIIIEHSTLPNQNGSFKDQYGWAIPLMPLDRNGKRQRPNFPALEKLAQFDFYRDLVLTAHGLAHTDSGGVTAMSLHWPGVYAFGPVNAFISTVARPSLESAIHSIGSTHLGFEDSINESAQLLGLLAGGAMDLARRGADRFPLANSPILDQQRPLRADT
jgi:hypothetical protein